MLLLLLALPVGSPARAMPQPAPPLPPPERAVDEPTYPLSRPAPPAPKITARAALVQESAGGAALFSKAADTPLPPASTIKLLAALTTLRLTSDLEEKIRVQGEDLVGGSTMGLQAGDTVTLGNLLKGMLIPSGNDAAATIARVEGAKLPEAAMLGPVPAFVARMNAAAAELGLTGTKAINPHGLDAPGASTTASDMAKLAKLVLADPTLAPIVRTKDVTVPSAYGSYPLHNTNELLGTPGIIGVKTGTEESVGQNLVLAVQEGDHRLYVVVLGSMDRYADARALLAYTRGLWAWVTLGDPAAATADCACTGTPGLGRALTAYDVAVVGRKTVILDRSLLPLLRYTLLLNPAGGTTTTPPTPPSAATAANGSVVAATASLPPTRGVIIFLLGDRELARMDVYAAGMVPAATRPAGTTTAPVGTITATALPGGTARP